MASATFMTEDELVQKISEWQRILAEASGALQSLKADCVNTLRRGGTAGTPITPVDLNQINATITLASTQMQFSMHRLLHDLLTTLQVTANGAIANNDPINFDNTSIELTLARFFGVSDASDIPNAWWGHDTGVYFIATEVNPANDITTTLDLAADDVILVQETNAATDTDKPAGVQKGRRLVVTAIEDAQTHDGVTYYGGLLLEDDTATPYALRDKGALDATAGERAVDTKLILRRVFDETV